jgi:hypothetical protein
MTSEQQAPLRCAECDTALIVGEPLFWKVRVADMQATDIQLMHLSPKHTTWFYDWDPANRDARQDARQDARRDPRLLALQREAIRSLLSAVPGVPPGAGSHLYLVHRAVADRAPASARSASSPSPPGLHETCGGRRLRSAHHRPCVASATPAIRAWRVAFLPMS